VLTIGRATVQLSASGPHSAVAMPLVLPDLVANPLVRVLCSGATARSRVTHTVGEFLKCHQALHLRSSAFPAAPDPTTGPNRGVEYGGESVCGLHFRAKQAAGQSGLVACPALQRNRVRAAVAICSICRVVAVGSRRALPTARR